MTSPQVSNMPAVNNRLPSVRLERMAHALAQHRFFKLIGGGSFTETEKIRHLVQAYAANHIDCIDVAPDPEVLAAVFEVLQQIPQPHPVIMISIPLDPDPHFRKIDLDEPDCIRCGLCVPVCPTEALALPEELTISQSLCYGCGRCVPMCPTDALTLLPFQVESQLAAALSHPLVEAVEIHSRYVDPFMLAQFMKRWQPWLHNKLISLCFRPAELEIGQIVNFYQVAVAHSTLPVILQIDGAPMSGNDDPEASRPALEAARRIAQQLQAHLPQLPPITISGGINQHTAHLLKEESYRFIAGVGMGTVARKAIWSLSPEQAQQTAAHLMSPFKNPSTG
jgi:ferredoxin